MASFVVPAELANIEHILDFIMMQAKQASFLDTELADIRLGCEEILINIVKYAYTRNKGTIEIICEPGNQSNRLTITFKDTGIPFNPLTQPKPDLSSPVVSRKIGGLGIYLTGKVMDEITYSREYDTNIITLTKR